MSIQIKYLCFSLLLFSHSVFGQSETSFIVQKWEVNHPGVESISFVRTDSSNVSQSTVLEYADFVVLLELPAVESAVRKEKNFKKETEAGNQFLTFIESYYKKSVRFVFVSHWHSHSISGIVPFLEKGVKFHITSYNWNEALKDGTLPNDSLQKAYSKQIVFIEKDTALLTETDFPINVFYLDSLYERKPTKDYMIYYLPKIKTLHASCMVAVKEIDYDQYEVIEYNDRLLDVRKVIQEKGLSVEHVIRLSFKKSPYYVIPYRDIEDMIRKGKSGGEMIAHFVSIDLNWLQSHQDSLLRYTVQTDLHPNLLRLAAYECLKQRNFDKALIFAKILCNYKPNHAFYVDVIGECYYHKGEEEMATYYDKLIKGMSDKYGIEQWKKRKIEKHASF